MLHHRGSALAPRLTGSTAHGVAEVADFLMLQLTNAWSRCSGISPGCPISIPNGSMHLPGTGGELSTFTAPDKRPRELPAYRTTTIWPDLPRLMSELRAQLSAVLEQAACVQIPLQDRKYGIRVGVIADRTLLTGAVFVLIFKASLPDEAVRRTLPALIKIGPVEQIRELVNVQLRASHSAPRGGAAPDSVPLGGSLFPAGVGQYHVVANGLFGRHCRTSGG